METSMNYGRESMNKDSKVKFTSGIALAVATLITLAVAFFTYDVEKIAMVESTDNPYCSFLARDR